MWVDGKCLVDIETEVGDVKSQRRTVCKPHRRDVLDSPLAYQNTPPPFLLIIMFWSSGNLPFIHITMEENRPFDRSFVFIWIRNALSGHANVAQPLEVDGSRAAPFRVSRHTPTYLGR